MNIKKIATMAIIATTIIATVGFFTFVDEESDAFTTSGSCGTNAQWEYDQTTKTLIIKGIGDMKDYTSCPWDDKTTIIDGHGGKFRMIINTIEFRGALTSIGDYAFTGLNVKTVVMTDSIKDIGKSAFRDCRQLSTITLSDSLSSIGSKAFEGCNSLSSVVIPETVSKIADDAFNDCKSLLSINIPDQMTSIPKFDNCSGLQTISLPTNLKSMRNYNLYDSPNVVFDLSKCTKLEEIGIYDWKNIKELTIPDSVKRIDIASDYLKSIHIGKSTNHISFYTNAVENYYVSPGNNSYASVDGVLYSKDMKSMWYPSGRSIESLITPEGVESVEIYNDHIKNLTIGEGTKKSDIRCKNLEILNIPNSLKSGAQLPSKIASMPINYESKNTIKDGAIIKYHSKYIDHVIISKGSNGTYRLHVEFNSDIGYKSIRLGTEYGLGDIYTSETNNFSIPSNISDYVQAYLSVDTGEEEIPPSEYDGPKKSASESIMEGIAGVIAIALVISVLIGGGGAAYYIIVIKK